MDPSDSKLTKPSQTSLYPFFPLKAEAGVPLQGKNFSQNVQLQFLCFNLWQQLLVLSLGTTGKNLGPSPDTPWKYL